MRTVVKPLKPLLSTAFVPLKRVIPAVLLSSMLPLSAPAQEAPPPSSSKDASVNELRDLLSGQPASAPATASEPEEASEQTSTKVAPESRAPEAPTDSGAAESKVPAPGTRSRTQTPAQGITSDSTRESAPRAPRARGSKARVIEEIIVSAQKREQFVQDVPISMSVMSEEFMKEQGIKNVADALLFVPNFKVVEIAGRVSPQCRGFTISDSNPAFEAPCGIALDGLAFSRGSYFNAGLFDLSRLEVLRGPQGTTFGKNTTAGLVALYSKDPTDEFTGNIDLQHDVDGPDLRRAEIAVGGPLIKDTVNIRVAAVDEKRGPYMENTYHQTDPSVSGDVGNSDREAYRIKLTFPDILGSGAELKLLHEKVDLFSNGYPAQVFPLNQAWGDYIQQYDPNAEFGENYKVSNLGNQLWTETERNQAELNFELAEWHFTGVGGLGKLTNLQDLRNALPTPFPLGGSVRSEESPYATAELRAVSPDFDGLLGLNNLFGRDLGSSKLLVGVFGQQNDLDLSLDGHANVEGLAIILLAGQDISLPVGTILSSLRDAGLELEETFHIRFDQRTETRALFSQLTWDLSDKWTVDLGARFSEESKKAHWNLFYSVPAPLLNTTGDRGFTKEKSFDVSNVQPKVSLTYRLNDDINLFAHWARAFKSGGFNAYTSTGDPERAQTTNPNATTGSLTYEDESGTDIGVDLKARLLDGQMQLNLSLFRLVVEDFQVFTEVLGTEIPGTGTRLPNGYQQVVNAGEARAQGAELDLTWLATDWLTVIGAVGVNDTEYLSFPLDNCGSHEDPDPNTGKCDHTGEPFLGAPKLSGTLTFDTRLPLKGLWSALGDTQFLLGTTIEYVGEYHSGSYAPGSKQDPNTLYRAHTGFANPSQGWSLRFTALNLTDEYFGAKSTDPEGGLATYGPIPPRSVFAQFSWNY